MRTRSPSFWPLALLLVLTLAAPAAAQRRIDSDPRPGPAQLEGARQSLLGFVDALAVVSNALPQHFYRQRVASLRVEILALEDHDLAAVHHALAGLPEWTDAAVGLTRIGPIRAPDDGGAQDGPCALIPAGTELRHHLLTALGAAEIAAVTAEGDCRLAPSGDGDEDDAGVCPATYVLKELAWAVRFAQDQCEFCDRQRHADSTVAILRRLQGGAPAGADAAGEALLVELRAARALLQETLAQLAELRGDGGPVDAGAAGAAVDEARAPAVPRALLDRPSPNPATGEVRMTLSLAEAAPVRVRVYDVAGALVAELIDRPLPAGEHALTWDPARGGGARVAHGVYFVRAEAGTHRQTRAVVVNR